MFELPSLRHDHDGDKAYAGYRSSDAHCFLMFKASDYRMLSNGEVEQPMGSADDIVADDKTVYTIRLTWKNNVVSMRTPSGETYDGYTRRGKEHFDFESI